MRIVSIPASPSMAPLAADVVPHPPNMNTCIHELTCAIRGIYVLLSFDDIACQLYDPMTATHAKYTTVLHMCRGMNMLNIKRKRDIVFIN